MKNALVFIDNNQIKVVFGSVIKIIKVNEMKLSYNVSFFEQLFKEANVYSVQQISKLTIDQLFDMSPIESKSDDEKKIDKSINNHSSEKDSQEEENDDLDFWVMSNAATSIIIDDLFTGRDIAEGIPESLSIPHGRAVNLSNLNQEAVKASRILRRLMDNKTLARCSKREAFEMERKYEENLSQSKNVRSIADGNISVDVVDGKAEKFSYSSTSPQRSHDLIESEIPIDNGTSRGSGLAHEEYGSMSQLMAAIESDSGETNNVPDRPRKQLAQRNAVAKTGIQAAKFKKAE